MTDKLICARKECSIVIETKKTFNQKYCSDECCRIATNQRIMQKYYERKARRDGTVKMCVVCNNNKLSRYNYDDVCYSCKERSTEYDNNFLQELFNGVKITL